MRDYVEGDIDNPGLIFYVRFNNHKPPALVLKLEHGYWHSEFRGLKVTYTEDSVYMIGVDGRCHCGDQCRVALYVDAAEYPERRIKL